MARMINAEGLALLKQLEGLCLQAYRCSAGVWTIGYGHTGDVKPGMRVTEHQADVILGLDLEEHQAAVERLCPRTNTNQFAALVLFCFNVGVYALETSTLRERWLLSDVPGTAAQFDRWVFSGKPKQRDAILVRRRAVEKRLFLTPPSAA